MSTDNYEEVNDMLCRFKRENYIDFGYLNIYEQIKHSFKSSMKKNYITLVPCSSALEITQNKEQSELYQIIFTNK